MPRKQQYPIARLIRFSRVEAEALRYIGGPRGMSEALRAAVWFYLQNGGRFDAEGFTKHARRNLVPKLRGTAKKAFLADLAGLGERLDGAEDSDPIFPVGKKAIAAWLGDAR